MHYLSFKGSEFTGLISLLSHTLFSLSYPLLNICYSCIFQTTYCLESEWSGTARSMQINGS
jgi:hypothetical protein